MAREFWEVFLPEDIMILNGVFRGKDGVATLRYKYPDGKNIFEARFVRTLDRSTWVLDDIDIV